MYDFICVSVFACVCVPGVCSAHRDQERVLDLRELELQVVVSCHVGATTEPSLEPILFFEIKITVLDFC